MSALTERAPAKINLTLKVHGRRPDGYHEIASLITFARDSADTVSLDPGTEPAVSVSGPFAAAIEGPNLIETTLRRLAEADPKLVLGGITLHKTLPVASGIGGGSSDAAAVLRAVRRANPERAERIDWLAIARSLGADVPVCLEGRPAFASGVGGNVFRLPFLPPLEVVLANPLRPVPADKTARVFASLKAAPIDGGGIPQETLPVFASSAELIAVMRAEGNDLAAAAEEIVPEIGNVRSALEGLPGALYVGLSGAGPTSFAVFASASETSKAAEVLKQQQPDWWVAADTLIG